MLPPMPTHAAPTVNNPGLIHHLLGKENRRDDSYTTGNMEGKGRNEWWGVKAATLAVFVYGRKSLRKQGYFVATGTN